MERNVEYALSHHDGNGLLKPHVPFALLLTSVSTNSGIRGTRSHHKTRRFDLTPLLRFGWSPPLKHQLPPSNTTASPNKHNWTHLTNTAAPPQRPLRQVKVLWCIAAIFTVVWAARQLQQQRTHDRHNRWPINSKPRGRLCHTIASSGRKSIILLK